MERFTLLQSKATSSFSAHAVALFTIKVGVLLLAPPMAGAKVNQLELMSPKIHDDVFVLQIQTKMKKSHPSPRRLAHFCPVKLSQTASATGFDLRDTFFFTILTFMSLWITPRLWQAMTVWMIWVKKFLAKGSERLPFSVMKSNRSLQCSGRSMTMM